MPALSGWCVGIGLHIAIAQRGQANPHPVRPVLIARDHARCRTDPGRIKPPRPVHRAGVKGG